MIGSKCYKDLRKLTLLLAFEHSNHEHEVLLHIEPIEMLQELKFLPEHLWTLTFFDRGGLVNFFLIFYSIF